uniref:Dynein heavy chain n=1 Tax=Globodera pallida TaxID=36090 RepID=A0A183CR46_GLOPA
MEHLNGEKTEKEEESVSEKEQNEEKEEEESVREEEQNEEKEEEESVREEEQNDEKKKEESEQNEEKKKEEPEREKEQSEEKEEEESEREKEQSEEKEEDSDWQSDENAEEYLKKVTGNHPTAPSAAEEDENQQKLITCPPKSVSVEMLRHIDKENNVAFLHFLSAQCMEYLSNHFEQIRTFKDGGHILKVQMYAILWYLSEVGAKLVKRADELKPLGNDQNRKQKLHLEVTK